jgi:hypothetical protein
MFEEMLEIKQVISLCYERQKKLSLYEQILKAQVWAFAKTIHACLNRSLVMNACVMNQSKGHWLLFDALSIAINLIVALESKLDLLAKGVKHLIYLMLNFTF